LNFNDPLTAKKNLINGYICVILFKMNVAFSKYQGTGNDFVIIDNRDLTFPKENHNLIRVLCDRRFGIGADGLMLLEAEPGYDFKMIYFNSDGHQSSMCGNGGRCLVAFAKKIGLISSKAFFLAPDGPHSAHFHGEEVCLGMSDVSEVSKRNETFFLDTGSPHHVQFVSDLDLLDVKKEGLKLRYGLYGATGANINFVSTLPLGFKMRTYERGVEDETLSCGTGVTAVAISIYEQNPNQSLPILIQTLGGELKVHFIKSKSAYTDIVLQGPAQFVFEGNFKIDEIS